MTRRPDCGACGRRTHVHGARQVLLRDLGGDGKGVRRSAEVTRFLCDSCGTTCADEPPETVQGTRITPALHAVVVVDLTRMPASRVAERHSLDSRTVRTVRDRFLREAMDDLPHPTIFWTLQAANGLVFGVDAAHPSRPIFARPLDDKGLRAWLSAHPGGLVISDRRHAALLAGLTPEGLSVNVDPLSLAAFLEERLPVMLRSARVLLSRPEADVLPAVVLALSSPPIRRTEEHVAVLAAAPPVLAELAADVDGLRRALRLSSADEARAALTEVLGRMASTARDVLKPFLAPLQRLLPLLLQRGWNAAFRLRRGGLVPLMPRLVHGTHPSLTPHLPKPRYVPA